MPVVFAFDGYVKILESGVFLIFDPHTDLKCRIAAVF